ncbi:MAG: UDP-N-acetylmuramate dehydrogenase, partial [Longimicrobiales bacterium]|nr:UDP-N-acetylmuramate dehydrogenase [Longimicrobiales bacterium]
MDLPIPKLEARLGAGRLERDVPLAPYTTFRIGGPADLLYRAGTPDELAKAVTAARALGVPYFVLGAGANILIGDGGIRGLVIRNEARGVDFREDGRVEAESGVMVYPDLIHACIDRRLGGLHHYVGIPSTVGGAIWQNLHFLSPDRERTVFLEEVVESCDLLTAEGERRTVGVDYLDFGYDYSILHARPDTVLRVRFRLTSAPEDELRAVVRENLAWRNDRHPDLWLYPSAGSIFKKIEGIGAGRIIDDCGLKGHVHGRVQVFHRHANILVNLGGATAREVRELIALIQERVASETGYEL